MTVRASASARPLTEIACCSWWAERRLAATGDLAASLRWNDRRDNLFLLPPVSAPLSERMLVRGIWFHRDGGFASGAAARLAPRSWGRAV